ncbi:hypothetical protein HMPREF9104_01820, partial [Lentilactobacillus kisonensis F0435]
TTRRTQSDERTAIFSDLGSVIVIVSGLMALILAVSTLLNAVAKLMIAWRKFRKHKK